MEPGERGAGFGFGFGTKKSAANKAGNEQGTGCWSDPGLAVKLAGCSTVLSVAAIAIAAVSLTQSTGCECDGIVAPSALGSSGGAEAVFGTNESTSTASAQTTSPSEAPTTLQPTQQPIPLPTFGSTTKAPTASPVQSTTPPLVITRDPFLGPLFGAPGMSFVVTHPPYNATGDGATDDTAALQACIDDAERVGATVHIPAGMYSTTSTLIIPAGVTLLGDGIGRNPLQITSVSGTIIRYRGTSNAVNITGHTAGIKNLVLFDLLHTAAAGISVYAETTFVESLVISNVLIYWFTDGTALRMEAARGGGIGYCSFYDIRIRHAKVGIELTADAIDYSFVNSNAFTSGAISGGGYDYGIWIHGDGSVNNNVFTSTVVEM